MKGSILFISLFLLIFILFDLYVYQGLKSVIQDYSPGTRKIITGLYWTISIGAVMLMVSFSLGLTEKWVKSFRAVLVGGLMTNYIPKLFFMVFLLLDDARRFFTWIAYKMNFVSIQEDVVASGIPRSDFLLKSGLVLASLPLVSISYGIVSGAYDYRVRRVKLPLKNLPSSFHGLKIAQISDIHSGSFFNKKAVTGGVELLMREKTDLVFFTGDLVNNVASELKDYIDIFSKVKAPLGVYSTLGNHDYGDYVAWTSAQAKSQNLNDLKKSHKQMGWNLLNNENHIIHEGGDQLAIIGVENWGAGARWPKHGRLERAVEGTEDAAVKLLLSHDPTHWDAQVRNHASNIDVTFSGHTHGCQFGIEFGNIRWSPAQYFYKQWAGLYEEGSQKLYVNRGFGFLGFPGRVGMPPEITIFELLQA